MELFNILTSFCNKYGYAYSVNHDSGNGCSCKVFRIVFDSDVDDFMHIGMLLGYYMANEFTMGISDLPLISVERDASTSKAYILITC